MSDSNHSIDISMLMEFHHFLEGMVEFNTYFKKKKRDDEAEQFVRNLISNALDDLSPVQQADLKLFIKNNAFYTPPFVSAAVIDQFEDYPAFRTYLESAKPEEFLTLVLDNFGIQRREEGESDDHLAERCEKSLKALGDGQSFIKSYREFKRFPDEMLKRFTAFLDNMYESYFQPQEGEIKKRLEHILPRHRQLYEHNRTAFMQELIKVDFSEMLQHSKLKYRFFLGYLNSSRISYSVVSNDTVCCMYNQVFERKFDPAYDSKRKAQFFKALSDETRVEIIKLVAEKERFATDLAKELNITKATMSYHMNMLAAQNIVNMRIGSNNRIYYSFNAETLETHFSNFLGDMQASDKA